MQQKDNGNRHRSWHEAVGHHHHRLRHLQPAITVCRHHPLSAIDHRRPQLGLKSIIRHHRLRCSVSFAKSSRPSHHLRLHFSSLSWKPSPQQSPFVSRRLHQRHYVNSCRKSCRRLSLRSSRQHRLLRVHLHRRLYAVGHRRKSCLQPTASTHRHRLRSSDSSTKPSRPKSRHVIHQDHRLLHVNRRHRLYAVGHRRKPFHHQHKFSAHHHRLRFDGSLAKS